MIKHCVNVALLQLQQPQLLTKNVSPVTGASILIRDTVVIKQAPCEEIQSPPRFGEMARMTEEMTRGKRQDGGFGLTDGQELDRGSRRAL